MYVGRTSQRFHIRRYQHVTKSLRTWIKTGLNKPTNRSSANAEKNNSECASNYSDSNFSIISKARSEYYLNVLESLLIKTLNLIFASNNLFINLSFKVFIIFVFIVFFVVAYFIVCFVIVALLFMNNFVIMNYECLI